VASIFPFLEKDFSFSHIEKAMRWQNDLVDEMICQLKDVSANDILAEGTLRQMAYL